MTSTIASATDNKSASADALRPIISQEKPPPAAALSASSVGVVARERTMTRTSSCSSSLRGVRSRSLAERWRRHRELEQEDGLALTEPPDMMPASRCWWLKYDIDNASPLFHSKVPNDVTDDVTRALNVNSKRSQSMRQISAATSSSCGAARPPCPPTRCLTAVAANRQHATASPSLTAPKTQTSNARRTAARLQLSDITSTSQ